MSGSHSVATPYFDDGWASLYVGDALETLRQLPDQSANMCVTSPPYWGLRDYGVEGQLGLEPTPEEYVCRMVDVFREVRRVLRDDGTLWVNIGDSYAGSGKGPEANLNAGESFRHLDGTTKPFQSGMCKPKDLVGTPWALATALRDPYYVGQMKRERDRVWLAAVIDSEGCISGFTHDRADGGGTRTGVNITITNTSANLLAEAHRIWPASQAQHENHGEGHFGGKPSWRWICNGNENRMLLLREIYPYLIAKRAQALLAYNLCLFMADAKRMGKTAEAPAIHEKRRLLARLISEANQGDGSVAIPDWCIEPPSATEPGWYLRSDIIWAKPNPMPESVTDRPTKAHEYVFLLSKKERYWYDADAIRARWGDQTTPKEQMGTAKWIGPKTKAEIHARATDKQRGHSRRHAGFNDRWDGMSKEEQGAMGRNKRTVWTIATEPYPEAHFATFPTALVTPCVLAGCPEGGTVLEPFAGSGTTLQVAKELGRKSVGIELNEKYSGLIVQRLSRIAQPFDFGGVA